MGEREYLAGRFEADRTRLRAVAYRMLGSISEADDAVQETWLRLSRADTSAVDNLSGWMTTVVARVSLDMLRSRNARREEPFGPRLPEPVVSRADGFDPEREALLADSVGLALLVGALRPGASRELRGLPAVAEQAQTFAHLAASARPALVNGAAGVVVAPRGRVFAVAGFIVSGGRIVAIDVLADPARLRALHLTVLDG